MGWLGFCPGIDDCAINGLAFRIGCEVGIFGIPAIPGVWPSIGLFKNGFAGRGMEFA